jgi:hypothetical protein
MAEDVPLVDFAWQGEPMYSCYLLAVPRVGDFVTLPRLTHPVLGEVNALTRWRVHAVEWALVFEPGLGERRPEVTVHLRRLHPHEWGNRHEPTGSAYDPIDRD